MSRLVRKRRGQERHLVFATDRKQGFDVCQNVGSPRARPEGRNRPCEPSEKETQTSPPKPEHVGVARSVKGRERKIKQKGRNDTMRAGAPPNSGHCPRARPSLLPLGAVRVTRRKIQARALERTRLEPRTHTERARVQLRKSRQARGSTSRINTVSGCRKLNYENCEENLAKPQS